MNMLQHTSLAPMPSGSPALGDPMLRPLSRTHSRGPQLPTQYPLEALAYRPPGDSRTQLFVGNLPFRVRWQDLKDLFRKCGTVLRSDVALTLDNRSKGFGTVLYANEMDAVKAIETYNGYIWQSRCLDVRLDQQDPTGAISMANAAAQAAQLQAQQMHQQAMQNMANIMGVNPVNGQLYSANHHSLPHVYHTQPHMASNPGWSASQLQAQAFPQQPGRRNSAVLTAGMASMNIHRPPSRNTLTPPSNAGLNHGPGPLGMPLPGSRPGSTAFGSSSSNASLPPSTEATSPPRSVQHASTSVSPPNSSAGMAKGSSSISPTSARRPPPGNLGPMPPSIFAGMSGSSQLPHPPAAAAAAVAAGYSIETEGALTGSADNANPDTSRYLNPSQQDPSFQSGVENGQTRYQHGAQRSVSPAPVPGGLVNFYAHNNASNGALQSGGPSGQIPGVSYNSHAIHRTTSPAYANRHLFVGNIPFNCQWQDLKDLFRGAGQILRADVSLGPDGRSRGFGTVLFGTPEDAMNAVRLFNGYDFQGRILKVHFDKYAVGGGHAAQPAFYGHSMHSSPDLQHMANSPPMSGPLPPQQPQYPPSLHQLAIHGNHHSFYDDGSSIPGTPIHETILGAHDMSFPSPGFTSPIQQQIPRSLTDVRPHVAPIGSGAPAGSQGQTPDLPPLMIPSQRMGVPAPSPHGMFSPAFAGFGPMSPQQGLPMMTPSMPGFSFHPFPQTPPLLPQFLSPGLGPFSPPLMGLHSGFFGINGPSSLRNNDDDTGDGETTPLQSHRTEPGDQHAYFPAQKSQDSALMPDEADEGMALAPSALPLGSASTSSLADSDAPDTPTQNATAQIAVSGVDDYTSDINKIDAFETRANEPDPVHDQQSAIQRRASFEHSKSSPEAGLSVPLPSVRAGSLDIARPMRNASETSGGSASTATTATVPKVSPGAVHSKRSPWFQPWLKK